MVTVSTSAPEGVVSSDPPLDAGVRVGEYEIEMVIGKGGFGTVYAAHHPVIGKRVAIKVLARRYAADEEIVSRFVSEARAVNQIRHRNIIDIFSFGQLPDGRHYYIMEYLDGETLDRCLARRGTLPLDEALPILRSLALALDAAHVKGIAHRDLKPENVFLASDPDGGVYPKLLDFGIAKLIAPEDDVRHRTGTGVPIGTPYYMSPEQCRGRDVDHRTDIYSFGVMTYRVLTGVRAIEGEDYMELLQKHVSEEPVPPSQVLAALPSCVDVAIAWMMKKDRTQRPATLAEGVRALDPNATPAHLPRIRPSIPPPVVRPSAGFAITAAAPPVAMVVSPSTPRKRWPIAVAVAVVGAVVALAVWHFAGTGDATPPSATTQPSTVPAAAPPPSPAPHPTTPPDPTTPPIAATPPGTTTPAATPPPKPAKPTRKTKPVEKRPPPPEPHDPNAPIPYFGSGSR